MGAAIGAAVIASIGSLSLLSEMRFNRNALASQSLRDSWDRSLKFIVNEALQAYWIRTTITSPPGYPCSSTVPGMPPQNPLVLDGPPNPADPSQPIWRVVYGIRSNPANQKEWRGVNRLVRCGPPFELIARSESDPQIREGSLRSAAVGGNLSFADEYQETTITDQLPAIATIPCPTAVTGPCMQPFHARVFNQRGTVDRDGQVNLFLSRPTGQTYPPIANSGFHAHIRASRNPGFDMTGNPNCRTTTDSLGNQVPNDLTACRRSFLEPSYRSMIVTQYNLALASGNLRINGCGTNCDGPRVTDTTEIIYLAGRYDDFTKQLSATDTRPCSRKSCYLQGPTQSLQVYDGNMLIFYDRIMRL
ncbi:MAG: hypothetical protein ACK587_02440 [Cyanobacteriota bacterium]